MTANHPVNAVQSGATLLRIALPVLISLAGIRLLARVFTVAFPDSGVARLVERLFSWLAWLGAVLWILGVLPSVMEEMEAMAMEEIIPATVPQKLDDSVESLHC